METPAPAPLWLIPLIVLGFPVVFTAIWSLVCFILATVSGHRSLVRFRVSPAEADVGDALPTPTWAMIGLASYRGGIVRLRSSRFGLTVHVSRLFPFHGTVRVPWEHIALEPEVARGFRGLTGTLVLDARVRLRLPAETFHAVRDAHGRLTGRGLDASAAAGRIAPRDAGA